MVPFASASFSNTPIGPFQMTVLAVLAASANSSRVLGPMSSPILSAGMALEQTISVSTGASIGSGNAEATTVSTGRSSFTPFSSAFLSISLQ